MLLFLYHHISCCTFLMISIMCLDYENGSFGAILIINLICDCSWELSSVTVGKHASAPIEYLCKRVSWTNLTCSFKTLHCTWFFSWGIDWLYFATLICDYLNSVYIWYCHLLLPVFWCVPNGLWNMVINLITLSVFCLGCFFFLSCISY